MGFPQPLAGQGLPLTVSGSVAPTRYVGGTVSGPPVAGGPYLIGDFVIDQAVNVWVCIAAGSPGLWDFVSPTDPIAMMTGAHFNIDPASSSTGANALVAATQYFVKVPCPHGGPIGRLWVDVGTAGVALTNSFLAVYRSDGTMLAQSADLSATWLGTGYFGGITLGPVSVTPGPNQFIWIMIYVGAATTMPNFVNSGVGHFVSNVANDSGANARGGQIALASTNIMPNINPANILSIAGGTLKIPLAGWSAS